MSIVLYMDQKKIPSYSKFRVPITVTLAAHHAYAHAVQEKLVAVVIIVRVLVKTDRDVGGAEGEARDDVWKTPSVLGQCEE